MGVLLQTLEIIFKVQRKMSNQQISRKKKSFSTQKALFCLFFFPSLDPSYFQSFYLFLYLFILNDLKCCRSITFSSTNHPSTLIATEQCTRIFWLFESQLWSVRCLFVLSSWPPLLWAVVTFSILIHFWRFLMCQMCQ